VDLPAPPLDYSLAPSEIQPYSEYTLNVTAPGYTPFDISGVEVLPTATALQAVYLEPQEAGEQIDNLVIPAHTLYGDYPPKIPEEEIKPMDETGEIVLSRVVVPEYVVVHDGVPSDSTARDYYVRYKDYIKNVACSEIYATWPADTIRANVLAIMSFTLNRVYTEWYRNKGYDFTITSSTAFDHKWIPERNIFESISRIVDELFTNYLSRPNVRQPILTQYCDGERVTCPNWMSQWGSKYLGDQNYSAIEILRYYYGDSMYINTAEEISGIPASWPRYDLDIGASGQKVTQMQEQLNTIAQVYTAIPMEPVTGYYDEATKEAVRVFQRVFKLPQSGIVDYVTWYKIQEIYVGVTRIAELD
jgi:peptidoglycan hydrolase-like protein with peptidoglycan-binding domain